METWTTKIEEDEVGPYMLLPDGIVEKYDLKEGDPLTLDVKDGALYISFTKTIKATKTPT